MSNTRTSKAKTAKAFEAITTESNKAIVERILDSIDASSCLSGHQATRGLFSLLGDDASTFLINLLEVNDIATFLKEFKDLSPETQKYCTLLHSIYGYRLHGILSGRRDQYPDDWIAMECIGAKYDPDLKKILLKFSVQKNNKECVIIEDSVGSMFGMAANFLTAIVEVAQKNPEFRGHFDIERGDIKQLNKTIDKLSEVIPTADKKDKVN